MKRKLSYLLLACAIFIAIVTRFYQLGAAPHGLYLDEAGQGYAAYSILKTGSDEFGKTFPIVFRSFTDFKTPVYIYLIVPLIPIFGLTSFTVRLPSFIFSILTMPIIYLLILRIAPKKMALTLSSLCALLLALSPWHILFGRTTFECNVALFFLLTGVLFFYKALEKPKYLIVCALFFAIAIPAYHAQRVITPLMMLILFLRHRKKLLQRVYRKYIVCGAVLGFVILFPTLSVINTPGFLARASGLNIFSHKDHLPAGYLADYRGILAPIANSSIFLSVKEFASLYISYFSPRNMFLLGDFGPRSSFPKLATFFMWQFPFYMYGLYKLIKEKNLRELRFFTLAFLVIAPIPAAVTRDPYSTIRSLQMVIPQIIIVSLGIIYSFRLASTHRLKIHFLTGLFVLVGYSLFKLHSSVIVLNEYFRGSYWNYGWQEASDVIKTFDKDIPVIVDNSRDEPYIQLAFLMKEDPVSYQQDNFEVTEQDYYTNMNRNKNKKIGNIVTRPIEWEKDLQQDEYLVGDALAISDQQIRNHDLKVIKDIMYPDGSIALRIVKTKE